jgi:outer membrane protein
MGMSSGNPRLPGNGRQRPFRCGALGLLMAISLLPCTGSGQENLSGIGLLEAVRITLAMDPVIRTQEQTLEEARGRVLAARGQFDPVPNAELRYQHNAAPLLQWQRLNGLNAVVGDTIVSQVGLDQQFRSGLRVTPSLGVTRSEDNFNNSSAPHITAVNLNITIPLLRGRGEKAVAANETAAEFEYEAGTLDLWHTISNSIAKTTAAYWHYQASTQSLAAYQEAEARLRELLSNGQKLAEADEMPPADLKQYESQLATATATRIGAEQALVEARQALGLAMGLPFPEMTALPPPADDFPPIDDRNFVDPAQTALFIENGLLRRNDLKAADRRLDAAESLLAAARNSTLPQVDLSLDVGYQGLAEGNRFDNAFASFARNVEGINAGASLRYRWPLYNRTAEGHVVQGQAQLQGIAISKENLSRTIRSDILVAASNLNNSLSQLRQAEVASQSIRVAFENEKKKQKLDMSTSIDVLLIQTLLTNATVSEVNAYSNYAAALVHLRFATATLFAPDKETQDIDQKQLTTLPSMQVVTQPNP